MRKVIYHYQDTKALTRELLQWIDDPASRGCDDISFSANASLSEEASHALVNSHLAQTVRTLEFSEIYFSPQQLADLLSMPALVNLSISGGTSYDWAGPGYVYPTLGEEHIQVLVTSPHSSRLRSLQLYQQELGAVTGNLLREALPNLYISGVEFTSY